MVTIIKLAIAGLVINALAHAGMAYFRFYQFKDEAEQVIRFAGAQPAATLQAQLIEKAGTLEIPVSPDNIAVERQGTITTATADYTEPVEFFPRHPYPLKMSFRVEAFSVVGASAPTR